MAHGGTGYSGSPRRRRRRRHGTNVGGGKVVYGLPHTRRVRRAVRRSRQGVSRPSPAQKRFVQQTGRRKARGFRQGQRRYKQQLKRQRQQRETKRARRARNAALKTLTPGLLGSTTGLPGFQFSVKRRQGRADRASVKLFGGSAELPQRKEPKPVRFAKRYEKLYRPKFLGQAEHHAGTAKRYRAKSSEALRKTKTEPQVKVAGFDLGAAADLITKFDPDPGTKIMANLVTETVAHPGDVASSSLRTAKESITGIPQGVKMLATDPGKALHAIAKDYERRYGPLMDGDSKTFRKRLRKDYGVTPYALDAAALASAGGTVAGKALSSPAAARLAARAAESRVPLGRAAHAATRTMREERPRLRISGGEGGTVPQRASQNVIVRAGQKAVDVRRARKHGRRLEAAGLRRGGDTVRELKRANEDFNLHMRRAAEAHRRGDRAGEARHKAAAEVAHGRFETLQKLAQQSQRAGRHERIPDTPAGRVTGLEAETGPGEVLPYFSPRESRPLQRLAGRTERRHGARKGHERLRLLSVGGAAERSARKAIRRLNKDEKDALIYAMEFGLSPDRKTLAVQALRSFERAVSENRRGESAHMVSPFTPDELPTLRKIIEDSDKHLTPRLREVADELRGLERRMAEKDPGLVSEQAAARRILPQAMLLGERRRPDVQAFHNRLREVEAKLREQGKNPGDLVAKFGKVGERQPKERAAVMAEVEKALRQEKGKAERGLATAERDAARAAGEASEAPKIARGFSQRAEEARAEVRRARAARDDARLVHDVSERLAEELKHRPGKHEPFDIYAARVERAAEEHGLEAPSYFEHTEGASLRRSLHAIGGGARAAQGTKPTTAYLFRMGRRSGDPEIVVNGLLRNAKRRFSWRFVINSMRQSAFDWSRGEGAGGLTFSELRKEFDNRQIDPDTVELVNVRTLENRELDAEGLAPGVDAPNVEDFASPTGGIHPDDLSGLHDGVNDATSREALGLLKQDVRGDLSPDQVKGQAMNRYLVIPKRDHAELVAATRPDGVFGRSLDILMRQKPARILLGLANTSWLGFQMMSNGTLAGLGRSLNPFDYVGAQKWWKGLSEQEKLAIEPELGITHHHHAIGDQTHLGAATNNRFSNAYRAFKQTKVMRNLHKGNPLDMMFRVDEAQNNFFRRTMFYTQARREAYRRMGKHWTKLPRLQGEMLRVMDRKAHASKVRAILDNEELFARHAQHVNEWLGDYLTYSSAERTNVLLRSTMFYGYLRFSLKLLFWTMPVKHPIMSDVLANLGQLGAQEIKKLLGLPAEPDGYRSGDVPPWMLAQVYFGTPAAIRGQKPGAGTINFGRMNPFMNAITQMEHPSQLFGLFSPLLQAEVDQMFNQSTFRGKAWRINGLPTPSESQRPEDYFGNFASQFEWAAPNPLRPLHSVFGLDVGDEQLWKGSPRGRILQRQLLDLAAPMRIWEDARFRGTQSDDALPWDPRPLRYKDDAAKKHQNEAIRRDLRLGGWDKAVKRLVPVLGPTPTAASSILKRQRELERDERRRRSGKKKKRGNAPAGFSGGGSGSVPPGFDTGKSSKPAGF